MKDSEAKVNPQRNVRCVVLNEEKYTPGPWAVHGEGFGAKVISPDRWIIAETSHIQNLGIGDAMDAHVANMHLIAAAPELLDTCEEALEMMGFGTFDNGVHSPSGHSEGEHWAAICRERLTKAIAKAKGLAK